MNAAWHQVAADPQTKPAELGHKEAIVHYQSLPFSLKADLIYHPTKIRRLSYMLP